MFETSVRVLTRKSIVVLLPACCAAIPAWAAPWQLDLTPQRFGKPEGTTLKSDLAATSQGLKFSIQNEPQRRNASVWTYDAGDRNLEGYKYCLVTYRAEGFGRGLDPNRKIPLVTVVGPGKDGPATKYPILELSKVWLDGREHTVLLRTNLPAKAGSVKVELNTDYTYARATLKRVEFFESIPQTAGELRIDGGWETPGVAASSFRAVSLNSQFNDSITKAYTRQIEKDSAAFGGALGLPAGPVTVDGMPFSVGPRDRNLVHAAEDSSLMEQKVKVFGEMVTRKVFLPPARNDAIQVPVNLKGSELYLLLTNEAPTTHAMGVTPIPYRVPDIESFTVKLNYADGTDLAFPWSASDGGYTIQQTVGAYAIPLDPKRVLKSVTFVNREWDKNVSLAGLTVNTSTRQIFSSAWKAPAAQGTAPLVAPQSRAAFARREGDKVVLGNSFYEVTADFSNGFALTQLRNLCNSNAAIRLDPASGFELAVAGRELTGLDFRAESLQVEGASVLAKLVPKNEAIPVHVTLRLTATKNEELQTNCTLNLTASAQPALKFPVLKNMSIGALKDTWYFFPQCGNSLTNGTGWYQHINSEGYSVQFMDAFNYGANVGVGLMTRNPQSLMLEYGGSRNDSGVTQYIKYDSARGGLEDLRAKITGMTGGSTDTAGANASLVGPMKTVTTSLVFHSGDWRRAGHIYQNWLNTWYKPVNAQNKKWWQDTWLIGCLWASDVISRKDLKLPPVLNHKTGKYYIDEAEAADVAYLGSKPDGYHFYQWMYNDAKSLQLYGETAEATYRYVGGKAASQQMVKDFRKRGQFVSMYYVPDRYGLTTEMSKMLDKSKIAGRDAAGNYLIWDGGGSGNLDTIAACPESEVWLDYLARNTNQVLRDLNHDSLYFDVFPFYRASCYAPDHGHRIPSDPNQGTLKLLKKVKALYPPKTTIWTEYLPSDVNSQYIDGTLSYSATTTATILSPRWDEADDGAALLKPEIDISRYTMPHMKQFCLPQGYNLGWYVMKQMLFNGKGLFAGSWKQWDSDVSKILGDQTRLLRKYNDCFTSDKPEHLVNTQRGDVYANKFPGTNRTLWTVLNVSGITIRDRVIAVAHKPNAVYTDAATGKRLSYTVKGNTAYVTMKLDPQSVSCLLQSTSAR